MGSEIILSLANTAFSSDKSSVDDVIDIFHSDNLSKNAKHIGVGLFILSVLVLLYVTKKHFGIKLCKCESGHDIPELISSPPLKH